jgi:hypothetical protein
MKRELEAAGVASIGILIAVVVLAFMLDPTQLAAIGTSFVNAVVGFFSSIPNALTSFIYGAGNDITNAFGTLVSDFTIYISNGLGNLGNSAGTGIENFFKGIWGWITSHV